MNALLWLGMIRFQCNESTKIRFCPDGWRNLIFDILCHSHLSCMWKWLASGPLFQLSSLQKITWSSLKSLTTFSWCWKPHFPFLSHPVTLQEVSTNCQVQSSSSHGWPWLGDSPWLMDFPLGTGPSPGACGIALAYDGADSTAPGMNGWKGARWHGPKPLWWG